MKCLEFRRELLIEPRQKGVDFLGHARDCPACGRDYQRALEFERRLHQALVAETSQEIDSGHSLSPQMAATQPGTRIWRPLLAATGFFLVLGITLFAGL